MSRYLRFHKILSTAGNCAHDEERLAAFSDRVGQGSIGRFVRNIFAASEEPNQRTAFESSVLANCAAQHRVFRFDRVENRFHSRRSIKIEMYLIANLRQRSEMMRKNDSNHFSVCTSTDRTAGKSRTIGFHESPASDDA